MHPTLMSALESSFFLTLPVMVYAAVLRWLKHVENETLANSAQALVFAAPHALVLIIRPDLWGVVLVVPVLALVLGWLRFRSKSVVPSALVHASGNFAVALATMTW